MGSSGGSETYTKQKAVKHLNALATSSPPRARGSVTGASLSQPIGTSRGKRHSGPETTTKVGSEKPQPA